MTPTPPQTWTPAGSDMPLAVPDDPRFELKDDDLWFLLCNCIRWRVRDDPHAKRAFFDACNAADAYWRRRARDLLPEDGYGHTKVALRVAASANKNAQAWADWRDSQDA